MVTLAPLSQTCAGENELIIGAGIVYVKRNIPFAPAPPLAAVIKLLE